MAFINTRLNDRYLYGFTGGPQWSTLANELRSGRQRRKKLWSLPKHKYATNYATLSPAEQASLLDAIMVSGGAFASFRFRDHNDFRAENQQIGTGDGTKTPLQLLRNYTFGGQTYSRPITLPINPVVTIDGSPVAVTVNATTGMVTPDENWPSGKAIFWNGQFDVRVHFSADYNPLTATSGTINECRIEVEEVWD